jgi:4'-phosphopantetheinyl transferase
LPARNIKFDDLGNTEITINPNEVHVWQAELDPHMAERLLPLLSPDERLRVERFRFNKDRNHFLVARGLLRSILASYLRMAPEQVRFSYAEKGKPALQGSAPSALINFNLAHSHERALYAFSQMRQLGVDLEFIREDLADEAVARRFFSSAEVRTLLSLPLAIRKEAFFSCWTRKEAYIKARGEGLSMPLDQFDVSFAPQEPACLLRNHTDPHETARWSMQSVQVPTGYVAALVVEGNDWIGKDFCLQTG